MRIALVFKSKVNNQHNGQRITVNEHELDGMIRQWDMYGYKLSDYWYLDLIPMPRP
jgi:hypothetical protein